MDSIETKEYKGHSIDIVPDNTPFDPREDDNISVFHCWHTRYKLGDEQYFLRNEEERNTLNNILKQAKRDGDIILPLYIYDHSGITISLTPFSCRWDSGQVGYVIISRKRMLKEFNKKIFTAKLKEKAYQIAKNEVKVYDMYVKGDVYGFQIKDCNGDQVNSCYGYFGSDFTDVINEAKSLIDYKIEKKRKNHQRILKEQIKNNAPFDKRISMKQSLLT